MNDVRYRNGHKSNSIKGDSFRLHTSKINHGDRGVFYLLIDDDY